MAKHIGRVGRVNAVQFAIEQLFEGIDWVLDPANNRARIKFKEPTRLCGGSQNNRYWTQPKETVAKNYCESIRPNQKPYILQLNHDKHPEYIEYRVDCDAGYGGVGFVYCGRQTHKETTLTYVEIASEIIKHAKRGHQPSILFLKEVDDLLKKASTTKPSVVVQPKPTTPKPTAPATPKDEAKPDVKPKPANPPKEEPKQCKPCQPYPVGTIGYIGPKKSYYGIHGTQTGTGEEHYILYRVGQKSPQLGCQCYWQEDKKIAGHHYMHQPNIFMSVNLNHKIVGNTRTKFLSYP